MNLKTITIFNLPPLCIVVISSLEIWIVDRIIEILSLSLPWIQCFQCWHLNYYSFWNHTIESSNLSLQSPFKAPTSHLHKTLNEKISFTEILVLCSKLRYLFNLCLALIISHLLTSVSHPLHTQWQASTLIWGFSNSILWSSEGSGEVLSSTREALLCFKYLEFHVKNKGLDE